MFGALELLPGLSWVVQGGDVGREQPLLQMEKTGNSEASTDGSLLPPGCSPRSISGGVLEWQREVKERTELNPSPHSPLFIPAGDFGILMLECHQDTWRAHTQRNPGISPTHPEGLRWDLELGAAGVGEMLQLCTIPSYSQISWIQDEPLGNLAAPSVLEGIPSQLPKQGLPKERKTGKTASPKYKDDGEFPKDREFQCGFSRDLGICSLWEAGGKREGTFLGYLGAFFWHELGFSMGIPSFSSSLIRFPGQIFK